MDTEEELIEHSSKSSTPSVLKEQKTKHTPQIKPNINVALPKELLLLVFSYLDIQTLCKCAQVCKPHVVEKIAKCSGGFLRDLRLSGCLKVTDDAIKRFTELCKQIEILDISGCKILTNETCKYLGLNCPDLTTLFLEGCQIDGRGLKCLGSCANLTWLNVSWCEINDEGVQAIASGCRNLKRFRAMGCHKITSTSVGFLARYCEHLTLLNLNYCERNINDQAMIYLAIGCSNLRVLCVSRCGITDIGLRALAGILTPSQAAQILGISLGSSSENAPNADTEMETEMLLVPYAINDRKQQVHPLDFVLAQLGHSNVLQKNQRRYTPQQSLIVNGCRQLTTLEIAACSSITDNGCSALARNCKSLEKLDLEDCQMVTDTTLGQLAMHCGRLNTLVLSHCDQITDAGIGRLVGGLCGADKLQNLAMDNCPMLTDASLEYLGKTCRDLRKLDLYDCMLITKEGINNFKALSPKVVVHAYFAPETPINATINRRRRICRCCYLL
ncbi:F-box/LRR-repeat protein 20 [Cichlidogyrus casuarinus]|uniref:F-box/LRR-repeat protein 20 n=1 Tax=Cichlidogyrus casuarinus TaxID=1844966 RepID=A0ABD2Q2K2_9PLAT